MTWDVARLQHNASVLYNDLCSYDGDKVYVDANGDLQFDDRFSLSIQWMPLGDYSKQATNKVAIRTLRNILHGLESDILDPQRIIKEIRVPLGCSEQVQRNSSECSGSEKDPDVSERWLDHKTFARNIREAKRFKVLERSKFSSDFESFQNELLYRRVAALTAQIQLNKACYLELKKIYSRFERYDFSSDEENFPGKI